MIPESVFFDVAKAFYKVLHQSRIYKKLHGGINPAPVRLIASFLSSRKFRLSSRLTERDIETGFPSAQ